TQAKKKIDGIANRTEDRERRVEWVVKQQQQSGWTAMKPSKNPPGSIASWPHSGATSARQISPRISSSNRVATQCKVVSDELRRASSRESPERSPLHRSQVGGRQAEGGTERRQTWIP